MGEKRGGKREKGKGKREGKGDRSNFFSNSNRFFYYNLAMNVKSSQYKVLKNEKI